MLPTKQKLMPCPGFESYCQLETGYTLNFPKSGSFIVRNIDYTNGEIRLFDPERCLAEKTMFSNSTSTLFRYKSKHNQYYMLYKCYVRSDDEIIINNRDAQVINCLGTKNYTVVSAPWNYTMPMCDVVVGGGGAVVSDGARILTRGADRDRTKKEKISSKFLLFFLTIGTILNNNDISILVMRRSSATTIAQAMVTNNPILQPSQTTRRLNVGSISLDQPTLDSYPIMVIGESGRFLNLSNQEKICPICLVDYQINDRLKILPECLHKFHVECIDEWLLLAKAMCPICRAMPSNFV
ncbi:hypothetical protein RND81_12G102800 [Saponaria officinalis]|uniref:RING-type E3 ubiquitin transferase n=1 Tax=Saponaria officinalis TaxID=3572 RepID=A0AAW1H8S6_SAPOF